MNEQLLKFIELCLMDGVISDKEREVIFRKSKELGVPEDECEIILEGMIQKHQKENQTSPTSISTPKKFSRKEVPEFKQLIFDKKESLERSINDCNIKIQNNKLELDKVDDPKQQKRLKENNKLELWKIKGYEKSLSIEKILQKLPIIGMGSVTFYNKLNETRGSFDSNQFNKIVRFLSIVENEETNYKNLLLKSHENYFLKPNHTPLDSLLESFSTLELYYWFSSVLVNEVNNDFVKFSEVYNKLEDKGFFLNEIEKFELKTLVNISSSIKSLEKSILTLKNVMVQGFKNIITELEYIDSGLTNLLIETERNNEELWRIDSSIIKKNQN